MKRTKVDTKETSATHIASDTTVRGDIHFAGRLYVSGAVKGNLTTDKEVSTMLLVDEDGSVEGDVEAAHVIVSGRVEGNVFARDRLEVTSTGRVKGEVSYGQLGVELGGLVNGSVVRVDDDQDRGNVRVFELSGDGDRET